MSPTLHVSLCILAASRTFAQQYTALYDSANYSSLDPCQQGCLVGRAYSTFDTEENAQTICEALPDHLDGVETCIGGAKGCRSGNTTAVYGAQSVLAAYCTSLQSVSFFPLSATTVSSLTAIAQAVVTPSDAATPSDTLTSPNGVATSLATSGSINLPASDTATGSASNIDAIPSSASTSPTPALPTPMSTGATALPGAPSSTAPLSQKGKTGTGLSSGAKAGIGVGVTLGVLLLIGITAAVLLMRRRKSRNTGPYGPVMTSEKGINESTSYSSAHAEPHEMQNMGSNAPFLPAIATRDMAASKEPHYEHTPATAGSQEQQQTPTQYEPYSAAGARPQTSRDVSRASTPPLTINTRPATAPHHLAPVEDEPPSPVSPVSAISPISGAHSRPGSLRHSLGQSGEHHDL